MIKTILDEQQLLVDINEVVDKFDRLDEKAKEGAISYASEIAVDLRRASSKYFSTAHYSRTSPTHLYLGSIKRTDRFRTKKMKDGRKLVGFTLKSPTENWKKATFYAYPLNLYENDVQMPTYIRKGTHIMKKLSTLVGTLAVKNEGAFLKKIQGELDG